MPRLPAYWIASPKQEPAAAPPPPPPAASILPPEDERKAGDAEHYAILQRYERRAVP